MTIDNKDVPFQKTAAKKATVKKAATKKAAVKKAPSKIIPNKNQSVVALSESKNMLPAKIDQMFTILQAGNPHPTTELNYTTVFELLVAVVLSAQATDVSVNLATDKLFKVAKTPQDILNLGEAGLKQYIRTIGLYNNKAKNIITLCQQLLELHDGEVPNTREALEALAGVGRKTANVVLNTYFNQPTIAVDTHVFRVSNRTGLAPGKNVDQVERALLKNIPPQYLQHAHHWLILHGRYTCIARQPKCDSCPIQQLCLKNMS